MDRKNIKFLLTLILVLLLTGCSMVFDAGVSGKVVTEDGTTTKPVSEVSVFAYTDKSQRDKDLVSFKEKSITRPSESSGYVSTSTTNANGEFTVNKIVWETKKSDFGKTDDVNKLYLIFYHKDYEVSSYDATIISGSTNSSNVYKILNCSKSYSTLKVNVYDATTGSLVTEQCSLEYWVADNKKSDKIVITGSSNLEISYDKNLTNASVKLKLSSTGTNWKMTDKEGTVLKEPCIFDIESGVVNINLYMKNHEIVLPAFSGDIDGSITDHNTVHGVYDNIPVSLMYRDKNGVYQSFNETVSANHKTYSSISDVGNNRYVVHGLFSGVGSGSYNIIINETNYPDIKLDLTDKNVSVDLRLVFGSKTYDFTYSRLISSNLGHIELN